MHLFAQADAEHLPLADASCDLVLGSPPYIDCRSYLEDGVDLGIARKTVEWVEWMMRVSREAVRVSRGAVLWVVAGKTEGRNYQPGPEGLIYEWFRSGGVQECPCYWKRVGIAGSGGDQWFRKDVEVVIAFKREPKLPWSDNTANGHPPKWAPGGEMSHRISDGTRTNQWGKTGDRTGTTVRPDGVVRSDGTRPSHRTVTKRSSYRDGIARLAKFSMPDGSVQVQGYVPPAIANPGNLVDIDTGGGKLGWDGAHENEAPYPQELAEWFIRSLCPPWVCRECGHPLEKHREREREDAELCSVSESVPDVGFSSGSEQVLQPGVREAGNDEASRGLPGMRKPYPCDQGDPGEPLLFKEVLGQMGREEQADDQGVHGEPEGIHTPEGCGSSERFQGRLRDGTPPSDGGGAGSSAPAGRGGAPQERDQVRQPSGKPGGHDEVSARPPSHGAVATDRVPVLRTPYPKATGPKCQRCGSRDFRPGIVLDPFSGSGSTVRGAMATGRRGIGFDLRMSQCRLGRRGVERPHAPVRKQGRKAAESIDELPLFANC